MARRIIRNKLNKVLALLLYVSPAFTSPIVTFKIGDVYVESSGKKTPAAVGRKLKPNDTLITGPKGRVSLRMKNGALLRIPANKIIALNKINRMSRPRTNHILTQDDLFSQPIPIAAGGTRANEEGNIEVTWADDPFANEQVSWEQQWLALQKKQYQEVAQATAKAKDSEGMYLNAMASYHLLGIEATAKLSSKLNRAKQLAESAEERDQCLKLQLLLNFEAGYYDQALRYSKEFTRFKKDEEISEQVFYALALSAQMAASNKEAAKIKRRFQKAYPKSKHLEGL